MKGLLWTGDKTPQDMANWPLAKQLRCTLDSDIGKLRGSGARRIASIIPGTTGVWAGILNKLKERPYKLKFRIAT